MFSEHDDRRRYFRIRDRIAFCWFDVADEQAETRHPLSLLLGQSLFHDMHRIDAEHQNLLHALQEKSRDLGQYLHALNQKIELIARQLVLQNASDHYRTMEVMLSGNGIGFPVPEPMALGKLFDAYAVLLSSAVCVSFRARVVWCSTHHDQNWVGAEITRISEHDRDAIIRHTLHVQAQQRRSQKSED